MKKIAISLLLFISSSSYAADWKLALSSNVYNIYLDINSFKDVNGNRRGWLMTAHSKEQFVDGVKFKSALEFLEVDCKEMRMKSLAGVIRTGEMDRGEAVGGFDHYNSAKWVVVIPGTFGESQADIMCHFPMK